MDRPSVMAFFYFSLSIERSTKSNLYAMTQQPRGNEMLRAFLGKHLAFLQAWLKLKSGF